jgi:hypothetical protein
VETERFDRLTRVLVTAPSRRALTRALFGLTLGGAAAVELGRNVEAKKCGSCKKKKKGKCKKKKPNDTACDGTGKCLNGTCNQPPVCEPAFSIVCFDDSECCSNAYAGLFPNTQCSQGGGNTPCITNADCISNVCVGFRCQ